MTFGRGLVVLLTKPSMFGKFLVHAWRFEQRTFYIGSLEGQTHFGLPRGAKMSLALHKPI
jgi:hypothetical protein